MAVGQTLQNVLEIDKRLYVIELGRGQQRGVIALNMRTASAIEFLARLFPFREFPNDTRALDLHAGRERRDMFAESQFADTERFPIALGVTDPLLGLPALGERGRVA